MVVAQRAPYKFPAGPAGWIGELGATLSQTALSATATATATWFEVIGHPHRFKVKRRRWRLLNPWHSSAQGGMHDTSGGRQGLMSTTRICIPLCSCSDSVCLCVCVCVCVCACACVCVFLCVRHIAESEHWPSLNSCAMPCFSVRCIFGI